MRNEQMLIYNGIINLDYTPATDILVTSMPDMRQFGLSEVSFCLALIIENIRNYDIKFLLLDSSHSQVDVENEEYVAVSRKFGMDLMGTRLKKIARLGTADGKREERAANVSQNLRQELNLPMEFKNFFSKQEAMDWLMEKEFAYKAN